MTRRGFMTVAALLGGATAAAGGVAAGRADTNRYYRGPVSDHFDGVRFSNPGGREPGGLGDLLRWRLGGGGSPWPERWPDRPAFTVPDRRVSGGGMRVTMVGHATLLLQVAGLNILTDPVYAERASPVAFAGPRRVNPPGIRLGDLPPIDLVLLTHNHYDHLDLDTLARLRAAHDPLMLTPLGNDAIVRRRVPAMRLAAQDWGDARQAGPVVIHCEPAHHWSARGMNDRRMALWSSFVVATPAGNIYHVGDTGFHGGTNYRAAGEKHGGFRLANLPIGAYEPRWFMQAQHQNPAEAVQGMALARATHAAGLHWGTFKLTDEPVDQPRRDLAAALARAGVPAERFRALLPGDVWDVP